MDTFYSLFKSDPLLVLGFLISLLVFAGACAIRARVKVTHRHEMDDREPEPLPAVPDRRRLHAIVEITNRRAS